MHRTKDKKFNDTSWSVVGLTGPVNPEVRLEKHENRLAGPQLFAFDPEETVDACSSNGR